MTIVKNHVYLFQILATKTQKGNPPQRKEMKQSTYISQNHTWKHGTSFITGHKTVQLMVSVLERDREYESVLEADPEPSH